MRWPEPGDLGGGGHLADISWPLNQFDYDNAPTLNLTMPGLVSGFSGVNTFDGTCETTVDYTHPQQLAIGGKLTVAVLRQTKRGGTADQMTVETQLLTGLQQATNYYVDKASNQYYTLTVSYGGGSFYLYFVSKR